MCGEILGSALSPIGNKEGSTLFYSAWNMVGVWRAVNGYGAIYKSSDLTEGNGGDEGIRTLDTLLRYTPLAGERLRPLGHVSERGNAPYNHSFQELILCFLN